MRKAHLPDGHERFRSAILARLLSLEYNWLKIVSLPTRAVNGISDYLFQNFGSQD